MKNKLSDLNDHLFAQMERLGSEDLSTEMLTHEVERTKAITSVAKDIVSNARLALDAKMQIGVTLQDKQLPEMLK